MAASSTPPLIKGYLPVRLRIPASPVIKRNDENHCDHEETYFYIREHRGKSDEDNTQQSSSKNVSSTSTLFVANAPAIPSVSVKILLHSIFGRFASVSRVTVVPNPRGKGLEGSTSDFLTTEWTPHSPWLHPTFLPPLLASQEGKYAHVVFASAKDLKQAKRALENIMSGKNKKQQPSGESNALELDAVEIQTLADKSQRQWEERRKNILKVQDQDDLDGDNSDQETAQHNPASQEQSGVLAVAQRYRDSLQLISRERILQECNEIMEQYELAEEARRNAIEGAKSKPDDDGFVTVNYTTAVGSKVELEQSGSSTNMRRKSGQKRSRKQKQGLGAKELPDFYRFQKKEQRQKTMEELRHQFQEDLKRVKRLKEEKQYRPF
ncbi:ribosomal RNA-processing protein 7 RRP7 [Nitzschia inconspicua]|uniref:Ribosomal RNA-processing protein 7 RRP7 n=1 Tax=Nitzschia inconspicua TaxID=303405 RepID=A0A9K3Q034_9STRA|nr:ribosomal RNA-processing protein 7 RRP7 [Nitzschia inconspicua]